MDSGLVTSSQWDACDVIFFNCTESLEVQYAHYTEVPAVDQGISLIICIFSYIISRNMDTLFALYGLLQNVKSSLYSSLGSYSKCHMYTVSQKNDNNVAHYNFNAH